MPLERYMNVLGYYTYPRLVLYFNNFKEMVPTQVVRFTVHRSPLIALLFSSYLFDDIEFAPDLCARLSGLLKEPDEL